MTYPKEPTNGSILCSWYVHGQREFFERLSTPPQRVFNRAFGGGPLIGSVPLRYVYVDEAGNDFTCPVSIVAGVIIHPDTQIRRAKRHLQEAIDHLVPNHYKENFYFHAKSLFGNKNLRENWSMSKRIALIKRVAKIPRILGMPVCFGLVRRSAPMVGDLKDFTEKMPISRQRRFITSFHHAMAFQQCLQRADYYVRTFGGEEEVISVIAEDCDEMKKMIRATVGDLHSPFVLPEEFRRPTLYEKSKNKLFQDGEMAITRVEDTVHFVKKDESVCIQIADACAWILRRCFAGERFGEEYFRAAFAERVVLEDWDGPCSAKIFIWPRPWPITYSFRRI